MTPPLAPLGGIYKTVPEDFIVRERMRPPTESPNGDWLWLHIERRGMTTDEVIAALAAAWNLVPRDIRRSGRKDKQAVCSQWFSLPTPRDDAPWPNNLTLLERRRAGDPLRLGMHEANRFELRLRGADTSGLDAWVAHLTRQGVPNAFGEQRRGGDGDNAARGGDLLAGRPVPSADRALRTLWLNAWQADRFDAVLADWLAAGRPEEPGDLVWHPAAGLALPRGRAVGGIATGPLFGARMDWPRGGAGAREAAVLAAAGWQRDAFTRAAARRRLWGARRPLWVFPTEVSGASTADGVQLSFSLPPGAYATTALSALGACRAAVGAGDAPLA